MANRTCSEEGCDGAADAPGAARGLCRNHYQQWWWKNRRPSSSDHRGIKRARGTRLEVPKPKRCEQCGTAMDKPPNLTYKEWAKRRFCSNACVGKSQQGRFQAKVACLQCGAPFTVGKRHLSQKFCSYACSYAYRDLGVSPAEKRIRMSAEYQRWRKAVFERDDYTCQLCGKRGGKLNADHIKPFALFPELRLDVDNGRTLCVACHRATDTYGSRVRSLHAS